MTLRRIQHFDTHLNILTRIQTLEAAGVAAPFTLAGTSSSSEDDSSSLLLLSSCNREDKTSNVMLGLTGTGRYHKKCRVKTRLHDILLGFRLYSSLLDLGVLLADLALRGG